MKEGQAMKTRHLLSGSNKGLTLIELVIAVVILTFGVVTTMTVLVQAESANNGTRAKTMAINAAEEAMESIFRAAPAAVLTFNGNTFAVGDLTRPGGAPPGLITVAATVPRTITVTVVWQGQGTQPGGQVTLTALRSEATR